MDYGLITAIGALLTGLSGLLSAILLNKKTTALIEYRLKKVEERLDKHNHYAEKLGGIAIEMAEMRKDVSYLREIQNEKKD